jgi:NADH-quinone oxidoreductase subunit L
MTSELAFLPSWTDAAPAGLHLCAALVLLAAAGLGVRASERLLSRVSLAASLLALAAAMGLALRVVVDGPVRLDLGDWFGVEEHLFPLLFRVDATGAVAALTGCGAAAVAARFSAGYLHKERGYARFLGLLHLGAAGHLVVACAGTLDLVFAGWELLGLAGVLLVLFFEEREAPVRNAFRLLVTYRLCDVGLIAAAVLVHVGHGSPDLGSGLPALAGSGLGTLVAAGLVLAAVGKSALVPVGGWLPRAMEGPTPSSALFYGALSLHAGILLLLRASPLLEAHPVLRGLLVTLGLATVLVGSASSRAAPDAKNALAYAAMGQSGLLVAEVGLGFTTLAVFHMAGHTLLRMGQFLRAPSALHDATHVRPAAGRGGAGWPMRLPSPVRRLLYREVLVEFRQEALLQRLVVRPVARLARALDAVDRRWFVDRDTGSSR